MRILLAAVGRAKAGPERVLFDHYAGRLNWPLTLKEVEEKRPLPAADRMAREAELLLAMGRRGGVGGALDEGVRQRPSEPFAAWGPAWRDCGVSDICFLIGGADGHGEAVRRRADLLLAFGAMTWPHMLVRGMLAEQLYRAQCILSGHPYHRA